MKLQIKPIEQKNIKNASIPSCKPNMETAKFIIKVDL